MIVECPFCGEVLNTESKGLYVEQTGWSVQRIKGGANQISLRKPTGRYAHGHCIRQEGMGVHRSQGKLI